MWKQVYSIVCQGKVIATIETADLNAVCERARQESTVPDGTILTRDGKQYTGRIVRVWSGPMKEGRGITAHVMYACGLVM